MKAQRDDGGAEAAAVNMETSSDGGEQEDGEYDGEEQDRVQGESTFPVDEEKQAAKDLEDGQSEGDMIDEEIRQEAIGGDLVGEGERRESFDDTCIDEDAAEDQTQGQISSAVVE